MRERDNVGVCVCVCVCVFNSLQVLSLFQKGCGSDIAEVKVSSSAELLEVEVNKGQRSEGDEKELNGDKVERNQDSPAKMKDSATGNENTVWNGDRDQTGTEHGQSISFRPTNTLLQELD